MPVAQQHQDKALLEEMQTTLKLLELAQGEVAELAQLAAMLQQDQVEQEGLELLMPTMELR
jgi:hypothetical protein